MSKQMTLRFQRGVALVLSLLLLLVMTLIGITAMSSTNMQERMASNARLQALAFEAASAGVADAIPYATQDEFEDLECGTTGHEGWDNPTGWSEAVEVGDARLMQRMYCLASEYDDEEGGAPPKSQLFVLSRGEVMSGDQAVAMREIEVRLDIGSDGTMGDGCGALCFPGHHAGDLDFPNSNAFQVSGNGGAAITTGSESFEEALINAIKDNRIGNYDGGFSHGGISSPWNNQDATEQFLALVESAAAEEEDCDNCTEATGGPYGTEGDPQVTYIDGNVDMGGNDSGAGIMVVTGDLYWNGTPNFSGLLVVMGGYFEVKGGGSGGVGNKPGGGNSGSACAEDAADPPFGGSLVLLNGTDPEDPNSPVSANFNGGGTACYKHDCDYLNEVNAELLGGGGGLWEPGCNTGSDLFEQGPENLIIASWRENIGWRDEFFGTD